MSSDPLLEQLADHLRAIDATSDTPLLESTQQEIREVAFGEEPTLYAADFSPGERASGPQPAFDAEFVRDREPVVDPVEAAVLGVEAIRSGSELEREPTLYAAAIVLKTGRPAVDVLDDSFVVPGPPWAGLADHRATISKRLPSIGRIRSASAAYGNVAGTGFLVGPGLLMTNRHVADYFALGAGREGLVLLAEEGASCDLAAEAGSLREVLLEIDEPVLLHPYWDVAVLRVSGDALAGLEPLRLRSSAPPAPAAGREVVVVGYPVKQYLRQKELRELRSTIFGAEFGVKKLLPGKLAARKTVPTQLPGGVGTRDVSAQGHDASTLAGNSGSAVIDPATGEVLAVHFKGYALEANYAVPAWELARDPQLRDLDGQGLSVSFTGHEPADPDPEVEAAWAAL